ncbi:hypothetical protein [Lysobacter sp. Root690]|uniref:XAC0095 family protein n=1 Tax=Lysobacter sp. Root690 TaxID=1736588 RepID=UPI0007011CF7|nr:hypothetical protein [Lysobacter sp. Root690]KRB02451.1 hypothetical protein ASD86_23220 [Lysobacter sp. Root690]
MSRKTQPITCVGEVILPIDAFLELQAFREELVSLARTIDPATTSGLTARKPEQSRRRALAKVFRLWAEQMDRSLKTIRSA